MSNQTTPNIKDDLKKAGIEFKKSLNEFIRFKNKVIDTYCSIQDGNGCNMDWVSEMKNVVPNIKDAYYRYSVLKEIYENLNTGNIRKIQYDNTDYIDDLYAVASNIKDVEQALINDNLNFRPEFISDISKHSTELYNATINNSLNNKYYRIVKKLIGYVNN